MKNFWQKMSKPVLCLAPMADVTDAAFRFIIAKYSKEIPKDTFWDRGSPKVPFGNYVTYTEFVSADGLVLAPEKGLKKLLKDLEYSEIEKPIVAQLFGSNPETIEKAAALIVELEFDGLDINMGCPDKKVEKQSAGAALIKNPELAKEIILAAQRGVKGRIPVSVKTRLGYNTDELEDWLPNLLKADPAAIIIHARSRKEMSKAPAKWKRIKRAVEIRNESKMKSLIIGNGDVKNMVDAIEKCRESGADGAMIGRAIFGQPWLFSNSYGWFHNKSNPKVIKKILEILTEHAKLFDQIFGNTKNFAVMKKHFKAYLTGLPNTKKLKEKLMITNNAKEVEEIINDFSVASL